MLKKLLIEEIFQQLINCIMEIDAIIKTLNPQLGEEIKENGKFIEVTKNTEVMSEGQYIKLYLFKLRG